ncbi:MAG: DUF2793 domain-containing protein [Rhodobacteraceae bacterium]|nr:DUF2793 domain-containing protein [Paracoccaceae bacterium]
MTETPNLSLPLLMPSQAQKHVTVNEAFIRLDALANLVLESATLATPPAAPPDGVAYLVPAGASGQWAGQAGRIALRTGGGWDFVTPRAGWRAFLRDEGASGIFGAGAFHRGQLTRSTHGAGLSLQVTEAEIAVTGGASQVTADLIPSHVLVFGVTAVVTTALTGTLTGWQLGNPGAAGRFGSGLGLAAGSFARGLLGQPMAFYAPTPLQLDAEGGSFAGGAIRVAVHHLALTVPGL